MLSFVLGYLGDAMGEETLYLLFCSIRQYFTTRVYKINVEMMMTVVKGAVWNVESSAVSTSDL
jgi:hypothetical protein